MTSFRYSFVLPALVVATLGSTSAAVISGRVTDDAGAGVAFADLDFNLVSTGEAVAATGSDDADANGFYAVDIVSDVYHVKYSPPAGPKLGRVVLHNVDLTIDQPNINVVLPDAWFVSGTITEVQTGLPAAEVDLDFKDLSTGEKISVSNDLTDLAGHFSVLVPMGIYEIRFQRKINNKLAPVVIPEISIDGSRDLTVPPFVVQPGYTMEGELDQGGALPLPVVNADIDVFVAATGEKLATPGDNTDQDGKYFVLVPWGSYNVRFDPPVGSTVVPILRTGISMTGDLGLGTDVLPQGRLVSGSVFDPAGRPIRLVDLDLMVTSSQAAVLTVHDNSNAAGQYGVRVVNGTYDIDYAPHANSLVDPTSRLAVGITANTTLANVILPFHDDDADGDVDVADNCPFVSNSNQADADADGVGDPCDNCVSIANSRQEDNDAEGTGDVCDADDDGDGTPDAGDSDRDGDGRANGSDNCPDARNPDQSNGDADGLGNACDPDDGEIELLLARKKTGFGVRPETGATGYEFYRQSLELLSGVNYGTCQEDELPAPVLHDTKVPDAGKVLVYLATARVNGVIGSLGRRRDGTERPNLRSCP